jgi:branched-chain amino acid transport system permease protein
MTNNLRATLVFAAMAGLLIFVGFQQSWNVSLQILNFCIISAIMSLGVNIQWGYAGLLNIGVMGFAALGGLAAMLVSAPTEHEAWALSWPGLISTLVIVVAVIGSIIFAYKKIGAGKSKTLAIMAIAVVGYFLIRAVFDPTVEIIEDFEPHRAGYLGGLGLPIILSWVVGGLFAAVGAWLIGKIALGLRADYLAIATLGISEIVIAMMKNEDWLTRGVKNVSGLPRPVPYELDLQSSDSFRSAIEWLFSGRLGATIDEAARSDMLQRLLVEYSSIFVKLCYAGLFTVVLVILFLLSERALNSPWGRMMRSIRDNETAAEAMGKDVKGRHLEVFILGAVVVGIAGAMMTTIDGQLTPTTYQPLRYTFLIWVMVIVGGSGNNLGSIVGGFIIWFFWIEAEPIGLWAMQMVTYFMTDGSAVKEHLLDNAAHMRLFMMGLILLLVMRFSPKGLIPERIAKGGD